MHNRLSGDLPLKATWASRGLFARFTREVERSFKAHFREELVIRARGASLAAALVMVVYSLLDIFMIPAAILPEFLLIRYGFVIVPMMLVFWVSFQSWAPRYLQWVNLGAAISSGLAITALLCVARFNGTPIAYEGIILTLFYFYCCGGLTLRTATAAGVVILIVYPGAEYLFGLPLDSAVERSIFLASTNAVGIISSAMIEQAARRNFALAVELSNQASRDYLTSLLNRRALRGRLEAVWRNAVREQLSLTLAMIDIDYFKRYNDHYGHNSGDKALQEVAQVLQHHTRRPLDLAARYGGEEFLCVWSGSEPGQIRDLLEHLSEDVRGLALAHELSPFGIVTLSVGALQLQPTQGASIKSAILEADKLLYQAKAEGRNRTVTKTLQPAQEAAAPNAVSVG